MRTVSRETARRRSLTQFYTGLPCAQGHIEKRWTVSGECWECHRQRVRLFRLRQSMAGHNEGGSKRVSITKEAITPEAFIASCEKKYGKGRYDYSLTKYTSSMDQVRIICPKPGHGEFKKRATNFLHQDQGCWKCFLEERDKAKEEKTKPKAVPVAPSVPEHVRNSLQVTLVLSQLGVSAPDIADFLIAKIPAPHIQETAALWQAVALNLQRRRI